MGLFTNMDDKALTDARKQVVPSERVCPSCKAPFVSSGATLSAFNAALGIEAHRCPHCGHIVSQRRPSADGL